MKKLWIIVAICAILVGLLLIASVFFSIGFDFTQLSTEVYNRSTHYLDEEFSQLEINTTFFNVKILPVKEGEKPFALLPNSDNITHSVTNQDGKLVISVADGRAWYEMWSFGDVSGENTVIELHLPHRHYEDLKILAGSGDVSVTGTLAGNDLLSFGNVGVDTGSGDIEFAAKLLREDTSYCAGFTSGSGDVYLHGTGGVSISVRTDSGDIRVRDCQSTANITLSADTGKVEVSDVKVLGAGYILVTTDTGDIALCDVSASSIKLEADTGDIDLTRVLVEGELRVELDTGDIEIERSDAGSLHIETDTGDVEMELLSGKMFTVKTDTGDSRYPASDRNGGICEVETDTGDVEIVVLAR